MGMINFNNNKFKRPYTLPRKGRGQSQQYNQSPIWQQNIAPEMYDRYKKTGCKFLLLWGPANIAKSVFLINFGEALPFVGHNVIISHTTNIRDQHQELIDHWMATGMINKEIKSITIQQLDSWIKKLNKGIDIEEEIKLFVENIEFMGVDELHKYSKGNDAKMLQRVCDYLYKNAKLKLVIGTTMTGKYINTIWNWAGPWVRRSLYTFRPNVKDLQKDGMNYPNNAEYLHCDIKTKVFDKAYTDSLNKRASDPNFTKYCKDLYNSDEDDAVNNLIIENHKLRFREDPYDRLERLRYQDNRVECAMDHWLKYEKGKPVIINVFGINNAIMYADTKSFAPASKIKQAGYEVIHWNTDSKNSHPKYKNDERKMLNDLTDPNEPLKVVITNGMLKEGTNEEIEVVYQCAFSPSNAESSIQLGCRGKITVIMIDAMNQSKIPATSGLGQMFSDEHIDRTPEELDALRCEQVRQNATRPNKDMKSIFDILGEDAREGNRDVEHTDSGATWSTILGRDIWVAEVEYIGTHKTKGISMHQNLIDALDLGGESVDVE